MKTTVNINTDVEVNIHPDDVIEAIQSLPKPEGLSSALRGLNSCLLFIKEMPNDIILKMDPSVRQIICDVLQQQFVRYLPAPTNKENPS